METKQAMFEKEKVVKSCSDWIQLAKSWKTTFDDDENALRCMKQAESMVHRKDGVMPIHFFENVST